MVDARDTSTGRGDAAERRAQDFLENEGLVLEARHYRIGGGPHRPAAEIDLVMRAPDGTLVFVEVRARRQGGQGGAAASIGRAKRLRIARAAQHYLRRWQRPPPCRFDVVAVDGPVLQWLPGAFDGDGMA